MKRVVNMNRRQWLTRTAAAAPATTSWLLPGGPAVAQPPAVKADSLRITDVKTVLTAPAGIRLVVVKVVTSEPEGFESLLDASPNAKLPFTLRSLREQSQPEPRAEIIAWVSRFIDQEGSRGCRWAAVALNYQVPHPSIDTKIHDPACRGALPLHQAYAQHRLLRHTRGFDQAARLVAISRGEGAYQSESYADGAPLDVFEGLRKQLAANRADFYWTFPVAFYSYNRDGAKLNEAVRQNWWRQAMMGAANAQFLGIKAFSETDFTEDLRSIDVPVLVLHGEDDQIVPVVNGRNTAELLKRPTLKTFPKLPHGMATTYADLVNSEILAFIKA